MGGSGLGAKSQDQDDAADGSHAAPKEAESRHPAEPAIQARVESRPRPPIEASTVAGNQAPPDVPVDETSSLHESAVSGAPARGASTKWSLDLLPEVEHVKSAALTAMTVLLLLRLASVSDYVSSTSLAVIREVGVVNAILGLSVPLAPLVLFVFGLAVVLGVCAGSRGALARRVAVSVFVLTLLVALVPAPYGPLGPTLLAALWVAFLACLLLPPLAGDTRGVKLFLLFSLLVVVATTPFDRTMWLPAERVTVLESAQGGQRIENAYVGYTLSQNDNELAMLMESPRGVVRFAQDDIVSRYVCQLQAGEQRLPLLLAAARELGGPADRPLLRRAAATDVQAECTT